MHRYFRTTPWVFLSVFACFLALPLPTGWAAEEASLVKDIWPGGGGDIDDNASSPGWLINVNGTLLLCCG